MKIYYWRVDVRRGEEVVKGDVWSFGGTGVKPDRSNVFAVVKGAKYREVTTLPKAVLALQLGEEKEKELHRIYNTFWSEYDNYKWYSAMKKALKADNLDEKKRKHLEKFNRDVMNESIEYLVENAQSVCSKIELDKITKIKF